MRAYQMAKKQKIELGMGDLLAAEYAERLIDLLSATGAHVATKYVSEKQVVRATRIFYRGSRPDRHSFEIRLQASRPNFAERKFIKLCVEAGEPFPVKKTQLKYKK